MGQILVWECEETGKLFREEKAYMAHLCVVARRKAKEAADRAKKEAKLKKIKTLYKLTSFEEIEKWLVKNRVLFAPSPHERRWRGTGDIGKLVHVSFENMKWSSTCSNTHNAPFGKRRNWAGEKHLPTSYPGWKGRISLCYSDRDFSQNDLKSIGICTGGGGGGRGCTSQPAGIASCKYHLVYDVTLWAHDFKAMHASKQKSFVQNIKNFEQESLASRAHFWPSFLSDLIQVQSRRLRLSKREITRYDKLLPLPLYYRNISDYSDYIEHLPLIKEVFAKDCEALLATRGDLGSAGRMIFHDTTHHLEGTGYLLCEKMEDAMLHLLKGDVMKVISLREEDQEDQSAVPLP